MLTSVNMWVNVNRFVEMFVFVLGIGEVVQTNYKERKRFDDDIT